MGGGVGASIHGRFRVATENSEHLEESVHVPNNHEVLGDSVAWGGCTDVYLLGQQLHYELFDFSYQVLDIAEVEAAAIGQSHKSPPAVQGWEVTLEAMKKGRRLTITSSQY